MADKKRETHIIRIFGRNREGDILKNMWVDIERIDKLYTRKQNWGTAKSSLDVPNNFQELRIFLKWDNESARNFKLLKIKNPDNPEEWVPVRVIKSLRLTNSGRNVYRGFHYSRDTDKSHIVHYGSNLDAEVEAALKDNPRLKAYVASKNFDYSRDLKSKDTGQSVDVEVIRSYQRTDSNFFHANGRDQDTKTILKNAHLQKRFNEEGGEDGSKLYRLDPFQNIINVQWGGLAVIFGPQDKNAPSQKKTKTTAKMKTQETV